MVAPRNERTIALTVPGTPATSEAHPETTEVWRIIGGFVDHITGTATQVRIRKQQGALAFLAYVHPNVGTLAYLQFGTYMDAVINAVHYLTATPYVPIDIVDGALNEYIELVGDATCGARVFIEVFQREGSQTPEPITKTPTSTVPARIDWWQ